MEEHRRVTQSSSGVRPVELLRKSLTEFVRKPHSHRHSQLDSVKLLYDTYRRELCRQERNRITREEMVEGQSSAETKTNHDGHQRTRLSASSVGRTLECLVKDIEKKTKVMVPEKDRKIAVLMLERRQEVQRKESDNSIWSITAVETGLVKKRAELKALQRELIQEHVRRQQMRARRQQQELRYLLLQKEEQQQAQVEEQRRRSELADRRVRERQSRRSRRVRENNERREFVHRRLLEERQQEEQRVRLLREAQVYAKERRRERLCQQKETIAEEARRVAQASSAVRNRAKEQMCGRNFAQMALEAQITASIGRMTL